MFRTTVHAATRAAPRATGHARIAFVASDPRLARKIGAPIPWPPPRWPTPTPGLTQAQLAARHGLTVAGARPSLAEYIRQLWAHRHFITAFANAKLVAPYSKAKLGQLWQVLTPLLNAAVYYLIFGLLLEHQHGIAELHRVPVTGVFVFTFTQTLGAWPAPRRSPATSGWSGRCTSRAPACRSSFTLIQLQQLLFSMVVLVVIVLVTGEPLTWSGCW